MENETGVCVTKNDERRAGSTRQEQRLTRRRKRETIEELSAENGREARIDLEEKQQAFEEGGRQNALQQT